MGSSGEAPRVGSAVLIASSCLSRVVSPLGGGVTGDDGTYLKRIGVRGSGMRAAGCCEKKGVQIRNLD